MDDQRRHHFSVAVAGGVLNGFVLEPRGWGIALDRLRADDNVWARRDVIYHGRETLPDIEFRFAEREVQQDG